MRLLWNYGAWRHARGRERAAAAAIIRNSVLARALKRWAGKSGRTAFKRDIRISTAACVKLFWRARCCAACCILIRQCAAMACCGACCIFAGGGHVACVAWQRVARKQAAYCARYRTPRARWQKRRQLPVFACMFNMFLACFSRVLFKRRILF